MVLPYINMNLPRVYTCSPSWAPLPLPFPYHPSGSSQCTSPKHPVSCIEARLAIRFLDCKEIQPVHSEGNQPWDFSWRNDAKPEAPVLWPSHAKSWLIGKDSDAGRDWGQEEKGTTEDEMAGWHHWLGGHESEWTPGVGDEQGGLVCCDSWGRKESDTTEWLNWTELTEGKFQWPTVCVTEVCKDEQKGERQKKY